MASLSAYDDESEGDDGDKFNYLDDKGDDLADWHVGKLKFVKHIDDKLRNK
jgi:hypothetical protein